MSKNKERTMRKLQHHKGRQLDLFSVAETQKQMSRFVSAFRIGLVRDEHVRFNSQTLNNPTDAQKYIQGMINEMGQPDREQFCVLMLNAKNLTIGMNIVSIGGLSSAPVCPKEVLKPAILANAAALILGHNHPSGDLTPSAADKSITHRIIQAAEIIGIAVHEHLIISMENDGYFSFAEHGYIQEAYDGIKKANVA
jgi:DNA repair protein RadC